MLRFHAQLFIQLIDELRTAELEVEGTVERRGTRPELLDRAYQIGQTLAKLRTHCENLQLSSSSKQVRNIRAYLEKSPSNLVSRLSEMLGQLRMRIGEDLEDRFLFSIAPKYVTEFYSHGSDGHLQRTPAASLFGQAVTDNFPTALDELQDAVTCLTNEMDTACVLHSMRALEPVLSALANRFGISNDNPNWHSLIERVEKAIREMDKDVSRPLDWKDQQAFFADTATHFMFIKTAWRNYAVHGRVRYGSNEARDVFENVLGFIQKLATKLHE